MTDPVYIVFWGVNYYPCGGLQDSHEVFATEAEAIDGVKAIVANKDESSDWLEVAKLEGIILESIYRLISCTGFISTGAKDPKQEWKTLVPTELWDKYGRGALTKDDVERIIGVSDAHPCPPQHVFG